VRVGNFILEWLFYNLDRPISIFSFILLLFLSIQWFIKYNTCVTTTVQQSGIHLSPFFIYSFLHMHVHITTVICKCIPKYVLFVYRIVNLKYDAEVQCTVLLLLSKFWYFCVYTSKTLLSALSSFRRRGVRISLCLAKRSS